MCSNHWPMLLDLSRDECKRSLRSLELNAYSHIVSAFRAQGDLNKQKKSLLQDLQNILSISTERHRAEVRRATNDEKLTTIADNIGCSDVTSEWSIEGRRLVPLMPRLVPQTAFTVTANSAANMQAEKNLNMPLPSQTGNKDPNAVPPPSPPCSASSSPRLARPSSPNSNVVVLPSGMAIHIKGSLSASEEEEGMPKKRRRSSSSSESVIMTKPLMTSQPVGAPKLLQPQAVTSLASMTQPTPAHTVGPSPMKITFTKSPAKAHTTVTPSQKVILVSNSQSGTSNILQRSLNVPMMKGTSSVTASCTASIPSHQRAATMGVPPQTPPAVTNGNLGNIITVATTNALPSSAAMGASPFITSSLSAIKPRTKTITATRPKVPQVGRSSMMIPMGAQHLQSAAQNIQIKSVTKPPIHIKQEGGMKIITQGVPSGTSKILPKPTVVTAATTSSITMVTKTVAASHVAAGRVLNITQGGRVIATTSRSTSANVVTVNPKTLQLTAIKGASGATVLTTAGRVATATGAKPNVIVVQKAQPKRAHTPTTPTIQVTKTGAGTSPFEKELMSFIQKQDTLKTTVKGSLIERKPIAPKPPGSEQKRQPIVVRQRIDPNMSEASRSSLLAELIHAVGIMPEGSQEAGVEQETVVVKDESGMETVLMKESLEGMMSAVQQGQGQGDSAAGSTKGHQWVDYDDPQSSRAGRVEHVGIKSLLTSQHAGMMGKAKIITAKPSDIEVRHFSGSPQEHATQVYSIDSSGTAKEVVTGDVQYVDLSAAPVGEEEVVSAAEQPGSGSVSVQLTNAADFSNLTSLSQEVLGELDPQTGIFYATSHDTIPTRQAGQTSMVSLGTTTVQSSKEQPTHKPVDFISSALTQAQIDLDPYQFVEEDEGAQAARLAAAAGTAESAATNPSLVSILNPSSSAMAYPTPESSQESESQTLSQDSQSVIVEGEQIDNIVVLDQTETEVSVETSNVPVSIATVPSTPSQTVITAVAKPRTFIQPRFKTVPEPRKVVITREPQIKTITLDQSGKTVMLETPRTVAIEQAGKGALGSELMSGTPTGQPRVVTVEELRRMVRSQPTTTATIRSIQRVATNTVPVATASTSQEPVVAAEIVEEDADQESHLLSSPGSGSELDIHGQRLSKRKRKPPVAADDSPPPTGSPPWTRMALGLLQKVSRFRGNKEKGELNASVWFLQPVDTNEVMDYLDVVESPMDFSTIKKKLEGGLYEDWDDFHDDMMLVRDNCILYNPPGSTVRNDCDEVFSFYMAEYDRTKDRWNKVHPPSPAVKKLKLDRSPVKQ